MKNIFQKKSNPEVAVALGGGAALGLAHIGVLKYLEEANLKPTIIAGTSMGSVIGGMYAAGLPLQKIEEVAVSFNNKTKVLSLLSFAFQKSGIISHEKIDKFFRARLKEKRIEDCDIDFIAVAVDLINGNTLYINKGDLVDALHASISIPGVFNPFEANGSLLVDGGVRENLPLAALQNYKPDILIAVDVLKSNLKTTENNFCEIDSSQKYIHKSNLNILEKISDAFKQKSISKKDKNLPDITTVGLQSLQLLIDENSICREKIHKPDLLINLDLNDYKIWEFWQARKFIDFGYKETKEIIENSNLKIPKG